ncbi:MAG: lytic transglycosylase domain-containing protein [Stellaceae bacterium]
MRCWLSAAAVLLLSQIPSLPSLAGQHKAPRPATSSAATGNRLDRVAFAVDGAESSHGEDEAMWRADPEGPQGPMQVTAAAASDVGGGDRFDTMQNREIGRAYLAQLYHRYGDWPDAIAAYNWGIGNFDAWVKAGRPADGLVLGVSAYLGRVLHDSGLCRGTSVTTRRSPRVPAADYDCVDLGGGDAARAARGLHGGAAPRFFAELDKATRLAAQHAGRR